MIQLFLPGADTHQEGCFVDRTQMTVLHQVFTCDPDIGDALAPGDVGEVRYRIVQRRARDAGKIDGYQICVLARFERTDGLDVAAVV